MRSAWKELRDRWQNDWLPWLEDHPGAISFGLTLLPGLAVLFKTIWRGEDLSHLSWLGIMVLVLLAPVIAWWLTGLDIRRRENRDARLLASHICLHCGYDMRATPERCPECGKRTDEPVDLFR